MLCGRIYKYSSSRVGISFRGLRNKFINVLRFFWNYIGYFINRGLVGSYSL